MPHKTDHPKTQTVTVEFANGETEIHKVSSLVANMIWHAVPKVGHSFLTETMRVDGKVYMRTSGATGHDWQEVTQ